MLPNLVPPLLIQSTFGMAAAIIAEGGLSFLGLGVQPPTASWGNMIREGMLYFLRAPWLSLVPGAGIFFAVVGFNMLGDGVRDALDPKLRGRLT